MKRTLTGTRLTPGSIPRVRPTICGQIELCGTLTNNSPRKVGARSSPGDATVSAFGRTQYEQTLDTFYTGMGGGWRWRGGFGDAMTTVENTPVGTLIVDVFDGSSKKLIWRGTSTDTLSSKPDKNEKKLEHSVDDMFKHFPPSHG